MGGDICIKTRPLMLSAVRRSCRQARWPLRRFVSTAGRPDILACEGTSFFKFGDPTTEPEKALFRDLTWRIRDGSSPTSVSSSDRDKTEAWALVGPRAALLADAAL